MEEKLNDPQEVLKKLMKFVVENPTVIIVGGLLMMVLGVGLKVLSKKKIEVKLNEEKR